MYRQLAWGLCLWILGAEDGMAADPHAAAETHWAFQTPGAVHIPQVQHTAQQATPIDAFLLEALEAAGLSFSPEVDRATWLRRVTWNLTGLPPTLEALQEFLQDSQPDAYERVVDRLLASPAYGEHWARMWLDVVRFAETAGFNADPVRPWAYAYRDYVIRAFNEDKPYDRFVCEQLAGDELFPADAEAQRATGYLRLWPDESNASDVLLARQAALNDLTANVSQAFLALSLGCSQCHDHKFDPLPQTDFYQLQAFFAGIVLQEQRPLADTVALAEYTSQWTAWKERTADLRHEWHALQVTARRILGEIKRLKFPAEVLEAIDTHPWDRSPWQHQLAFWSERQIEIPEEQIRWVLDDRQRERWDELLPLWQQALREAPQPPPQLPMMAVAEITHQPPPTFVLAVGSYQDPLEEVAPGFPQVLRRGPHDQPVIQPPHPYTSGRRSALARWLVDPQHPLTYRVWVNRVWQAHFGTGLVEHANDFGTLTPPPSHPALLDWLAQEFVRRGCSTKDLQRMIVLSRVYRQLPLRDDCPAQQVTLQRDPENRLYGYFPRRRLTAEQIRDGWLMLSGTFNEQMYGPGVRPQLPPRLASPNLWKPSERPSDHVRRSVYIFAKRNLPYPMLQVFDFPDMHESCACRAQTVIAPQALMLLNSDLVLDAARRLADRLLAEVPSSDPQAIIERLWWLCFSRSPSPQETQRAWQFLATQHEQIARDANHTTASRDPQREAWADLCHALLNANEFLHIE
ncbi:MAG: cytochrome c [Planctomycetaceae bacterium]|nr:MAG: cytochrome c [Planctomycetaceae bacterium]